MRWPWHRQTPASNTAELAELDRRVEQAQADLAEVRAMRPESERLGRRMNDLNRRNHLAERVVSEWAQTWKGRPA